MTTLLFFFFVELRFRIKNAKTLDESNYKGQIYETFIFSELKKHISFAVDNTDMFGEKNNIAFTNFVSKNKDTSNESWSTIDGIVSVESKCTTGTYTFETVEKLVDATDGSDNIESGILKLNGATYTFENPYVTIKAGSQEETIKQSELEKRMSTSCTI